MTNNNWHKLLERYWQGETSLEEEKLLQNFFCGDDSDPEELKMYKSLFLWKNQQKAIHGTAVQPLVPKKPVKHYFYPAMKIAASVLIVLLFGIGVYTHYRQEQFMDELFSDSSTDVLDARKDSTEVVAKVSLQLSPEQMEEEDSILSASPETPNVEKE